MISYLVERMTNFLSRSLLSILLLISGHQALAQNVCVGDVILNVGNISTVSIDINWSLTFGTVNGFRIEPVLCFDCDSISRIGGKYIARCKDNKLSRLIQ